MRQKRFVAGQERAKTCIGWEAADETHGAGFDADRSAGTRCDTHGHDRGFYHGEPDRAGNYIVPGLKWQSVGAVRRDQTFDGHVDGHIYAQPLYWRPSGSERGLIIAPTEDDLVYALDAATGRVVWRTNLGHAAPLAALPCGNIDPLGVTGTPVIDAARGAVYLDAMVDDRGTPRHLVYGLRLADGTVLPGFPIDVAAGLAARGISFDPATQGQRGALALLNGRIFVPFGGHFGDCGDYHGAVVAVGVDPPQLLGAWVTRARKGGIWAPAGLSEADGSLYFSTGNTAGARDWQDGEGVFRIGPDLAHLIDPHSFFAPSNWKQLDDDDLDLGGVAPLPLTLPGDPKPLLLGLGRTAWRTCLTGPISEVSAMHLRCSRRRAAPSSPPRLPILWEKPCWSRSRRVVRYAQTVRMCRASALSR